MPGILLGLVRWMVKGNERTIVCIGAAGGIGRGPPSRGCWQLVFLVLWMQEEELDPRPQQRHIQRQCGVVCILLLSLTPQRSFLWKEKFSLQPGAQHNRG